MIDQQRLYQLLQRAKQHTISGSEYAEIEAFLNAEGDDGEEARAILDDYYFPTAKEIVIDLEAPKWQGMLRAILNVEKPAVLAMPSVPATHRMNFIRKWWWAAATLIIGTTIAVIVSSDRQTLASETVSSQSNAIQDVSPGGEHAVLTLADGSTIALDSAANGQIARQGNTTVVKLANGEIRYDIKGVAEPEVMMNTMSTPRGGQYQLILPDGSKVWLNAASSITYPATFVGRKREVKVMGEVYFEIAPNKAKPFVVDVNGQSFIQVLGTSFNVNAYTDEAAIKTTLIDGSVRIGTGSDALDDKASIILKPGQQAFQSCNSPNASIQIQSANISQVLAWKNGLFDFNGLNVHEVMNQLSRWYDIDVRFEGKGPDFTFIGEIYRSENLSVILKTLQRLKLKYRMEGKTLVIL